MRKTYRLVCPVMTRRDIDSASRGDARIKLLEAARDMIRETCAAPILGHAATLEPVFAAALADRGVTTTIAQSLALHIQTVVKGAFVMAKAANQPDPAHDALDHLDRYLRLLLDEKPKEPSG